MKSWYVRQEQESKSFKSFSLKDSWKSHEDKLCLSFISVNHKYLSHRLNILEMFHEASASIIVHRCEANSRGVSSDLRQLEKLGKCNTILWRIPGINSASRQICTLVILLWRQKRYWIELKLKLHLKAFNFITYCIDFSLFFSSFIGFSIIFPARQVFLEAPRD